MAEIYPFETKEARANRLAMQITNPVEEGIVPSVTEAVEEKIPLFPEIIKPASPDVRTAVGLPSVRPIDTRDVEGCATLIRDRAIIVLRSLIHSYSEIYGHQPTDNAKELYTTVADVVALIDCQELLGVEHPYSTAFKQFVQSTK